MRAAAAASPISTINAVISLTRARWCGRNVQRGPVRVEHEAEPGDGEERAAEDEGDRDTCQGEARNLERRCAPLSKQERRAHRNRRDENRNQDREPEVVAEQHAPAMLSRRCRRDKRPSGTALLRLHWPPAVAPSALWHAM